MTAAVRDETRRKRGMGAGVGCLVLLGLTLGAVGHVAVHTRRLEVALELGKQDALYRELSAQKKRLEIEIGMLKNPERIEAIAREKLDMGPAQSENIRHIGGAR